jgi:excinuclease UvrABC ATPase subunit
MSPSSSESDRFGTIQVRGARENNLKNISVDIPRRRITVFTGVSGSGKSSLVFDTIAAESQRLLNETFSTFVQNFLPRYGQPDVDVLANLSTAIIVDQQRIGGNPRSTLGTATDIYTLLRVLFSRLGKPAVPHALALSFNDPTGMCPECEGLGRGSQIDIDALVDKKKSLEEGAILFPAFNVGGYNWHTFIKSGFFDVKKPLKKYTNEEWNNFLHIDNSKVKVNAQGKTINSGYEGLIPKFKRLYLGKDAEKMAPHLRPSFERIVTGGPCTACGGTRLSEVARACRVNGKNIAECSAMQVSELAEFIHSLRASNVAPLLARLSERLDHLVEIGLGYLSLSRETATLSGGESQRVKVVRHLSSSLTRSHLRVRGVREGNVRQFARGARRLRPLAAQGENTADGRAKDRGGQEARCHEGRASHHEQQGEKSCEGIGQSDHLLDRARRTAARRCYARRSGQRAHGRLDAAFVK